MKGEKRYRGSLGGLEAHGPSVEETKRRLLEMAAEALGNAEAPTAFQTRNHTGLVWYEPVAGRWVYGYAERGDLEAVSVAFRAIGSGYASRHEAEMAARRHIAQNEWDPDNPDAAELILHPRDDLGLNQHRSWANWQLRRRTVV
jgi:hypothetical protein